MYVVTGFITHEFSRGQYFSSIAPILTFQSFDEPVATMFFFTLFIRLAFVAVTVIRRLHQITLALDNAVNAVMHVNVHVHTQLNLYTGMLSKQILQKKWNTGPWWHYSYTVSYCPPPPRPPFTQGPAKFFYM